MFGALLAYFYHYHGATFESFARRQRWPLLAGGVAFLTFPAWTPFLWDNPFFYSVGYTLLYLGSGAILASLVVNGIPDALLVRTMAAAGIYSYSIYLWHRIALYWIAPPIADFVPVAWTPWRFAALYMALALVLGVSMSLLIERPVLRLRDRLLLQQVQKAGPDQDDSSLTAARVRKPAFATGRRPRTHA